MAKNMILRKDIESAYHRLLHTVENRSMQEWLDLDLYTPYICPDCGSHRHFAPTDMTGGWYSALNNGDALLLKLVYMGAVPREISIDALTEPVTLGAVNYPLLIYASKQEICSGRRPVFTIDTVRKRVSLELGGRIPDERSYEHLAEIPAMMNEMIEDLTE